MSEHQRILEFDVKQQRLLKKRDCDFSSIVAGTVGYLRAKFYFSEEWDSWTVKAASFWLNDHEHGMLLDENNSCDIPPEVLKGELFEVSVTGARAGGHRIGTNKIKVKQGVY